VKGKLIAPNGDPNSINDEPVWLQCKQIHVFLSESKELIRCMESVHRIDVVFILKPLGEGHTKRHRR